MGGGKGTLVSAAHGTPATGVDDGPDLMAPAGADAATRGRNAARGETPKRTRAHLLGLALLALINIATCAQAVLWVRGVRLMRSHDFFWTQVAFPVSVNVVCWPIVAVMYACGWISPLERSAPWWMFAVLALLAGGGNLINAFPQSELPGSLITIVGTAGVPVLMILSCAILKTRYRWQHYAAAALIVAASIVVVAPKLGGAGSIGTRQLVWVAVLIGIQFLPEGPLQEKWLKQYEMSVMFYRGRMGLCEVLLGMLLIPTMLLHVPGHTVVKSDQLWHHLGQSWRCFRGLPVDDAVAAHVNATQFTTVDTSSFGEDAACRDSLAPYQVLLLFVLFWVFNIASDLMLVKYGSAVFKSMIGAVQVPVTVALFQWEALAGVVTQHGLHWYTWVGMVVATVGVVLYTSVPEVSKQRQFSLVETARSMSLATDGAQGAGLRASLLRSVSGARDDYNSTRLERSHDTEAATAAGTFQSRSMNVDSGDAQSGSSRSTSSGQVGL